MSETESETYEDDCSRPIIGSGIALTAMVLLAASTFAIGYTVRPTMDAQSKPVTDAISEQARSQRSQADLQIAQNKRISDLQIRVVEECVKRGNIPVFVGGNVDCKAAK